jgi:hypothetical protein
MPVIRSPIWPRFNIAPTDQHFIEFERRKVHVPVGFSESVSKRQQPRQPMHQRQGGDA